MREVSLNRFETDRSVESYRGPRKLLRPMPGGPFAVMLKYFAPPPGQFVPSMNALLELS